MAALSVPHTSRPPGDIQAAPMRGVALGFQFARFCFFFPLNYNFFVFFINVGAISGSARGQMGIIMKCDYETLIRPPSDSRSCRNFALAPAVSFSGRPTPSLGDLRNVNTLTPPRWWRRKPSDAAELAFHVFQYRKQVAQFSDLWPNPTGPDFNLIESNPIDQSRQHRETPPVDQ